VSSEGSVTRHLTRLKAGDHAAAVVLWRRYFQRMTRVAKRRLSGRARRAADEEDVALDAFDRFCREAEQGRLPEVQNRSDLWGLLATLTIRMAIDQLRREGREKRGGLRRENAQGSNPALLSGRQCDPGFIAQVAEECDRLLASLDDATLRSIAVWKTEGYTNEEIAEILGVVLRTVERKLHDIRERMAGERDSPAPR